MAIEEVSHLIDGKAFASLMIAQEFSIEIPDKEADAILSSMLPQQKMGIALTTMVLIILQSTKQ